MISIKMAVWGALSILAVAASAQTSAPQTGFHVVDGHTGTSLASAYSESCKSGGTVIVDSSYAGKEPVPASTCDHHVVVLDLRQADSATGRLNVKNFGAAGDGKTDDTAAVRAAIAYSLAHLAAKGAPVVYFPAGTYVVKGEFRISNQITITGDGPAASSIQQTDPQANLFTVTKSSVCFAGGCRGGISNITLAGNGHLTTGNLLEIENTEEYRIEHILMYNHGGRGLQLNANSERLDSHDFATTLVRWPIVLAADANESYFYDTKVLFPGATIDGWCYNINCVNGKYPTQGPIAPDPHAAVTVYMGVNVGFYGGSIKSLQMIGGFNVFNTGVTTLDHFYLEYGYVNAGVIAGGVPEWTTLTAPVNASTLSLPVKSTDWMAQYYNTASDVPPTKTYLMYVIIPPDFSWGSNEPSSLGSGITKGAYEVVQMAGFAGDGAAHLGAGGRGTNNTTAHAWPAGAILEARPTGLLGLRVSNSHIHEQDPFSNMGPQGAHLTPDCDNTGSKTCAEIILGYVPDGRWVQPRGSKGDTSTAGNVSVLLDNVDMYRGGTPHMGEIAVHSLGILSTMGHAGGLSDGETSEVPLTTSIVRFSGGSAIQLPTYANGAHPSFTYYDGDNGRVMSSDFGFFTQYASINEGNNQFLSGRQYANTYSIFDLPATGKQPLNSFTLTGGPNAKNPQGLHYDHWNGKSWTSLFSVNTTPDNNADVKVAGVLTAQGLKIGNGPVITSLSGGGAAGGSAAAPSPSTLSGKTAPIGGSPLAAGRCATGTASISGATPSMAATTSPAESPGDGFIWQAFVSQSNTVTVKVCALAAGTPAPSAYDVRVFP